MAWGKPGDRLQAWPMSWRRDKAEKNPVSGLVQYVTSSVFEWNICLAYSTQIFLCLFTILGVFEVFLKLLTSFCRRNRKGLFDYSYLIRISLLRMILILFELFHLLPGNYAGSCLTRGSLVLWEELIKLLIKFLSPLYNIL